MRKVLGILLIVFVAAFIVGASTPNVEAGPCYYKCSCEGIPLRCCLNNGVETCKKAIGFECPQVYGC